jgi:hypothetical protein
LNRDCNSNQQQADEPINFDCSKSREYTAIKVNGETNRNRAIVGIVSKRDFE